MNDLSLLSAGERKILEMLAEGHTAKSAAAASGLSVAAVNERLRAARRKTGVGSSRELARRLRQQESRDEEIGISEAGELPQPPSEPATGRVGRRLWMPLLVIAALAAAVVTVQQDNNPASDPPAAARADPLLGGLVDPRNTISDMHARIRSETRDDPWATRAEAALRARYARVPNLVSPGDKPLRVTCARTLCEVAGALPQAPPLTKEQNVRLFDDLQSQSMSDDLAADGLASGGAGFGENFVAYWTRKS